MGNNKEQILQPEILNISIKKGRRLHKFSLKVLIGNCKQKTIQLTRKADLVENYVSREVCLWMPRLEGSDFFLFYIDDNVSKMVFHIYSD